MGPKNDIRYKVSATWRVCYESMTAISSVPEKSVRCREVSAIKDVRYKEVSLYFKNTDIKRVRDTKKLWKINFISVTKV